MIVMEATSKVGRRAQWRPESIKWRLQYQCATSRARLETGGGRPLGKWAKFVHSQRAGGLVLAADRSCSPAPPNWGLEWAGSGGGGGWQVGRLPGGGAGQTPSQRRTRTNETSSSGSSRPPNCLSASRDTLIGVMAGWRRSLADERFVVATRARPATH